MEVEAPDTGATVRGCVVLAHGLNTTPAVMDGLGAVLRRDGYACARVSLHQGNVGRQHPADVVQDWLRAFDDAHGRLVTRHPTLPVSAVGYSLGGLIALLRAARPDAGLHRLVLWAPPLVLTRSAAAVRLLTPGHRFGLRLLSAAPREARARSATPVAEYAALLRLIQEASALSGAALAGTNALVLLGSRDPLVSRAGVRRWVQRRRLTGWRVEEVDVRDAATPGHRHLIVSEAVLDPLAWERTTSLMLGHLGDPG